MKFKELIEKFSEDPFFEMGEIQEISESSESQLKNQLSQWTEQGKIVRLRRGKYLLGSQYRKFTPSIYYISNFLYRPSYVSLETALQYYELIPEAVTIVQAVTPKHGREWSNDLSRFVYRSIKKERFWGYREDFMEGIPSQNRFFIAKPEKAILDLIYLNKGEWTKGRLSEMRFQSVDILDYDTLKKFSKKFDSPRLEKAAERFIDLYGNEIKS